MKRTFIASALTALMTACATAPQQPGFQLSGKIEGLQTGDTLLLTEMIMPRWQDGKVDTLIVKEAGRFSAHIPMEHTTFYLLDYKPKVGQPLESCIRGEEIFARINDHITLKGSLEYLGALHHSGGSYDDEVVKNLDSVTTIADKEMIDIYRQIIKYQKEEQRDSVDKYGQMYNTYRSPKEMKTYRDSLTYRINDTEYAAFMYVRNLFDKTYSQLKERLEQFTPEVRQSSFGQILDRQLTILKNIEVGESPKDFTLTDKDGNKVSLSNYKGKYTLIYHWGLCPGTFWVNPKIMELYEKYHDKGFEVLGLTREDLNKLILQRGEEFRNLEEIQGLLNHPWTTCYTSDEANAFINDELYLSGVPILMFISPEGITLARGYTEVYQKVKDILEKEL